MSRMENDRKDSYKPAKAAGERRRNPSVSRGGTTDSHTASDIDNLIRKKSVEVGISTNSYLDAWQRFKDEVAERYDKQKYSTEWRVWKAQTLLWDHFCKFVLNGFLYLLLML
jgi:hypothetical protein